MFLLGDEFVLQMDLLSHIFDHMVVDDALVRIILPEGASNIEIETPYAVSRLPDSLHFTYLDTKGRPVVEIAAKNLVENHIQPFKVIHFFGSFYKKTNFFKTSVLSYSYATRFRGSSCSKSLCYACLPFSSCFLLSSSTRGWTFPSARFEKESMETTASYPSPCSLFLLCQQTCPHDWYACHFV